MNENQKRKLIKQAMLKQAGEVRFVKDDSNSPMNAGNWAWGGLPASSRTGVAEFDYNPDCSEDLANVLKSTLIALSLPHCLLNTPNPNYVPHFDNPSGKKLV